MLFAADCLAQAPRSVRAAGSEIEVISNLGAFSLDLGVEAIADGLEVVRLRLTSPQPQPPPRLTLKWSLPSQDVAGQWTTGRHLNKTIRPDWSSGRLQASMFAREAPVSCLFGGRNANVQTFAVSDALNTVLTGSGIREEDGRIYNEVVLFSETHEALRAYEAELRIDRRPVPYWRALADVAQWWAERPGYEPAPVPETARQPAYSTWYNFHQSLDPAVLLREAALAKQVGLESVIVDDGWQTRDSGRGYAYTGDWEPERIPEMKAFVEGCHRLGLKVLLWYAVPFVGKHARAAERFGEMSLRFDERLGAYVLDPRFPEVREHVVETYAKALRDFGLDGFKLDFIDRFVADEKTRLVAAGGRDQASVNEATDRMLTSVLERLRGARPDVLIEFRQPYIGPLVRKYGNMFRASDCPNSYLANRVKTVDLRLLSGATAVHADMILWHPKEAVELAALQLLNVLFSVPQVSVRLSEIPADQLEMLRFYIAYWKENRAVLLDGGFEASSPLANYPLLVGRGGGKQIAALYEDLVVPVDAGAPDALDVVNAKGSTSVVLRAGRDLGRYRYSVRDCRGRTVATASARLGAGPSEFAVPASGLLSLVRER